MSNLTGVTRRVSEQMSEVLVVTRANKANKCGPGLAASGPSHGGKKLEPWFKWWCCSVVAVVAVVAVAVVAVAVAASELNNV